MARQITDSTFCECCIQAGCISGSESDYRGIQGKEKSSCNDYLSVYTQSSTKTGMYRCTGNADDAANIIWSGGSRRFTAGLPEGPCYGTVTFDFNISIQRGTSVSCTAESWAGGISCSITCCYISAP